MGIGRKGFVILLSSLLTTISLVPIFMIQEAEGGGLRSLCIGYLNMSADRCDDLIDAGKIFVICRGLSIGYFSTMLKKKYL
jgi:hypothetical protein